MKNKEYYCGTDYYNKILFSKGDENSFDPTHDELYVELNSTMLANVISNINIVHTIPVAVHIVYNKSVENISRDQVLKQIETLNKDFRNKNVDQIPAAFNREKNLATDSKIEFSINSHRTDGSIMDNITRTYTSIESFEYFEESGGVPLKQQPVKSSKLGGIDAWNAEKYLNVWVCNLETGPGGYAQYPRRKYSGDQRYTDGIVIDYRSFGIGDTAKEPYELGKTLSHEIGHWLGLYHLWGPDNSTRCDSDDLISDTPTQRGKQLGCPKEHSMKMGCDVETPLLMNLMDFVDDKCSLFFTREQVLRMRYYLEEIKRTVIKNL